MLDLVSEVCRRHGLNVRRFLGAGETNTFFEAFRRDGETVIIKCLNGIPQADEKTLDRFAAIAKQVLDLRFCSIVRHLHAGCVALEGRQYPYLVTRKIEGINLADLIGKRLIPFTIEETAAMLLPVAAGIDHIHGLPRPLLHRDVKPANIVVPRRGTTSAPAAILVDFGISSFLEEARPSVVAGRPSLAYAAPEVGRHAETRAADIYSLGLVAFEMLCLTSAYDDHGGRGAIHDWIRHREIPKLDPKRLTPESLMCYPQLTEVMAKVLSTDPERRFGSGGEFISALGQLAAQSAQGEQRRQTKAGAP